MILSLAHPDFYRSQRDPLHIVGFTLAHVSIGAILLSCVLPRWFDMLVPVDKRAEDGARTVPRLESTVVDTKR